MRVETAADILWLLNPSGGLAGVSGHTPKKARVVATNKLVVVPLCGSIERDIVAAHESVAQSEVAMNKVFPHSEALVKAKVHAVEVNAALEESAKPKEPAPAPDAEPAPVSAAVGAGSAVQASHPPLSSVNRSSQSSEARKESDRPSQDRDIGRGF